MYLGSKHIKPTQNGGNQEWRSHSRTQVTKEKKTLFGFGLTMIKRLMLGLCNYDNKIQVSFPKIFNSKRKAIHLANQRFGSSFGT